ncbi:hypothetical protein OH76DRAFT_96956 [Lentinus brumalis]|uniref:Uncharacterized protein n=1 Tax=Lentinus brumalis TaxID=2498619 RepID=A0A371CQI3_9APHY|nr:hypothetical protein OH76DRAFT_96956 [Polyporus brumalis]
MLFCLAAHVVALCIRMLHSPHRSSVTISDSCNGESTFVYMRPDEDTILTVVGQGDSSWKYSADRKGTASKPTRPTECIRARTLPAPGRFASEL